MHVNIVDETTQSGDENEESYLQEKAKSSGKEKKKNKHIYLNIFLLVSFKIADKWNL